MKKKRIVIADICSKNNDGKSAGHYFPVAQNYIETFSPHFEVLVAGGPIYDSRFASYRLALPYDFYPKRNRVLSKLLELINCISLFRKTKGDIVVLQSVAQLTAYIAILLFYRGNSNLFLIQYYTESINSKLKRTLWTLIKHKIDGILCSSERVGLAFDRPYIVVTDYIKTGLATADIKSFNNRKYDFCLIGGIYRDKGQVEALKALACKGFKTVIAGKINEPGLQEEIDKIQKVDSSIEMHLGYISETDYHYYIRNSKYCILNYSGTYNDRSSGVVLDVIFDGTPVVGQKCGALELVEKNCLGSIYEDIEKYEFDKLLNPDLYLEYQAKIEAFVKYQSVLLSEFEAFLEKEKK